MRRWRSTHIKARQLGIALSVVLLAVSAGCADGAARTGGEVKVTPKAPYYGGVQGIGIVGEVQLATAHKPLKDITGRKANCQVQLTPWLNFRQPEGTASDFGKLAGKGESQTLPATDADWCRGLHEGAGYLIFWDPEANIHFTEFGKQKPAGEKLVERLKRSRSQYCRVSFVDPYPSEDGDSNRRVINPYPAGPLPQDYCDEVMS